MKILLTGFEPFGGRKFNTSYEAVRSAGDICGADVRKICLPVTWAGAVEKLSRETDDFSPDAVILCGLASGASGIRVERVGINLCGAIRDNAGLYPDGTEIPSEKPISNDGENAYFSTFNHKKILQKLREEGIPSEQSFSAGTYICNLVLYSALKKNFDDKASRKIGFIHVPDASELVEGNVRNMELCKIARAIEIAMLNCD